MHKMAVPWNPEVLTTITAFLSSVASMQAWLRRVSMSSPPPPSAGHLDELEVDLAAPDAVALFVDHVGERLKLVDDIADGMAKPMPSNSSSLVRRWTMVIESSVIPLSVAWGGESGSGVAVQYTSSG